MPEWFVLEAAKVMNCSFMELDEHPQKHTLMGIAFTLQAGNTDGMELIRVREAQRRGST